MTFEQRQTARIAVLSRLVVVFQAVAIGYLALHATVSWLAYREAGGGAALVTLLTLGFGDLYWLVQLARRYGLTSETAVAVAATLICFASWLSRPAFNRWVANTERELLSDAAHEIGMLTVTPDGEGDDDRRSSRRRDA